MCDYYNNILLKKQSFLKEKLEFDVKRYLRKRVKFADDCGFNLEKKHNIQSSTTHDIPQQTLSKVTKFLLTNNANTIKDACFLESTGTNKNAVFGTIVARNTEVNIKDLKIVYTWNGKVYHSTPAYYLCSKSERFLFKIPAPKRKTENVQTVKFFVQYEGKRFTLLNNGMEYEVAWCP